MAIHRLMYAIFFNRPTNCIMNVFFCKFFQYILFSCLLHLKVYKCVST